MARAARRRFVRSLRTVASLVAALTILQLALGLLGVALPLAMAAGNLGKGEIGVAAAAYALGFMGGAWIGPRMLARVGHIRVFALAGAVATATVLTAYWAQGLPSWFANRFVTGGAAALLFAAGESWLSGAIGQGERGGVIGFYMVCTKAALALGPFLMLSAAPRAPEPLMIAAMLLALASAPISVTSRAQPEPPKAQPLAIGQLYRTAPGAVLACFAAGLINSAVLAIAPVYAHIRFGAGAEPVFQAAAWTGSLILQWPAGRLSDLVDRRLVIAGLTMIASLAALALALGGATLGLTGASILFAFWGAGALSYYGVAVAHMADRAEHGQLARATSGLLFVWAFGSVIGPIVLGYGAEALGNGTLFWYAAALGFTLAALMLWRRAVSAVSRFKIPYVNKPATSVAAAELAYGESEQR